MSKSTSLPPTTLPDDVKTVALRDVAGLIRAPLIKDATARGGTVVRLASIADLPEYGILPTPKRTVRIKSGRGVALRFGLEDHDVVMRMVGTIGRIGIVPADREENPGYRRAISSSFVFVSSGSNRRVPLLPICDQDTVATRCRR